MRKNRKALIIASEDEELSAYMHELTQNEESTKQKMMFVEKQVDTIKEAHKEEHQRTWRKIESRLKELGKLDIDYSHTDPKHGLSFNKETTLITLDENGSDDNNGIGKKLHEMLHDLLH